MAKEDTAPGLLSKLVKFVRNPTTNWAELDSVNAAQDDGVSKHVLKEMVERKRRNDFVRKREFDMLRKMRKLHTQVQSEPEPGGKPSFFHSSLTSRPDERAVTLKKIDDIEAQMSMQWWKNNNQVASEVGSVQTVNHAAEEVTRPPSESLLPVAYRPTVTLEKETVNMSDGSEQKALLDDFLKMSFQESSKAVEKTWKDRSEAPQTSPAFSYAASLMGASPVSEQSVQDAELEEAAIFFANGDDVGAEASLLKILAPGALRENDVTSWLTLFDLYRATDEQEKFDVAAIEFVERFDRSAPQWLSLPDLNKQLLMPDDKQANQGAAAANWICPSILSLQSVAALNATLGRVAMPWLLDWSHLKTIERAALEPLRKLFGAWAGAGEPTQLCFKGAAHLREVLCSATPSGEPETLQLWWLLRLEVLRVMHRPDEFELAALDFCITYEVSPPAWAAARCDFLALGDQDDVSSDVALIQSPDAEGAASTFNPVAWDMNSDLGALSHRQAALQIDVELSGQLQGHSAAALERLEASLTNAGMVNITCSRLLRVDFSSAGMLLNWVSARQAENRVVRFTDVNRLIASFFNVIGITEYATVTVRPD